MLERQTRALEESLNKLKIAMHPDKNKTRLFELKLCRNETSFLAFFLLAQNQPVQFGTKANLDLCLNTQIMFYTMKHVELLMFVAK